MLRPVTHDVRDHDPSWPLEVIGGAPGFGERSLVRHFGLPRTLPRQSLAEAGENMAAIEADYRFVLERLGPCVRSRR